MSKKRLTPMEIIRTINKALAETDGIIPRAFNENCWYYHRPDVERNGCYKIKIKVQPEGNVIGTYEITYLPDKHLINDEWDIHFNFICCNSNPELEVADILRHSEPDSYDPYWDTHQDDTFYYEKYNQNNEVIGYTTNKEVM